MTTTPTTTDPKRRALGRGLDSLLPRAAAPAVAPTTTDMAPPPSAEARDLVQEIPLHLIEHNPYQTRGVLDETALEELAASIRHTGVVQPILVRHIDGYRYQLIAGERRWRASERAGKAMIPAIVRAVSNEKALEMTIIENLQREDLNAMEQARAFERLSREFGLTQEQIAERTGKDRASVANYLRLLRLPEQIQLMVRENQLSFGHAKVLMAVEDRETLIRTAGTVVAKALSVRQTEELVFSVRQPHSPPKSTRYLDPNVREAEQQLQRSLGVKVEIKDRNGKGKIIIQYASLEDFDRVVDALKK